MTNENRIDKKFSLLRDENKKALITFITFGDPDIETSKKLVLEMEREGADLIEIGVPFSDPMAEGPVIQAANVRALKNEINLDKIFCCLEIWTNSNHRLCNFLSIKRKRVDKNSTNPPAKLLQMSILPTVCPYPPQASYDIIKFISNDIGGASSWLYRFIRLASRTLPAAVRRCFPRTFCRPASGRWVKNPSMPS